jgi:hypothetical protein
MKGNRVLMLFWKHALLFTDEETTRVREILTALGVKKS